LDESLRELIQPIVDEAVERKLREEIQRLQPPHRWLTIVQAAERFGIQEAAVRQRIRRGQLASRMLDGRRYVDIEEHDRRLDEQLPCPPQLTN
jgi:DNA-directed RNA polymerase specialized sigma24 family protein